MTEQPLTDGELDEAELRLDGHVWGELLPLIQRLMVEFRAARQALREIAALPYKWTNVITGEPGPAIEIARAALPREDGRDG